MGAASLFGPDLPAGMAYRPEFITEAEEAALLQAIASVTFAVFEMRGVATRRRVAFFGESYDRGEARPVPDFLFPLRAKLAAWAGITSDAFAMALINEYPPGAPIGWHRDAPQYGIVAGLSLLSECRMRLRPYLSPADAARSTAKRSATHGLTLERRSAYLMTGASRQAYEHHIPPVAQHRYSITFRTLRDRDPR